jgi:2'-phosphotransferase
MDEVDALAEQFESQHQSGASGGNTKRGGNSSRGGRGGRGGGGGGGQSREVGLSRALSSLLRHNAESAGIRLDAEGYAPLDRVVRSSNPTPLPPFPFSLQQQETGTDPATRQLQWPRIRSLAPSVAELRSVVATNDKQRFSMKPNPATNAPPDETSDDPSHWLVRANQGHTMASVASAAGLHAPVTLEAGNVPEVVVHGTYFCFWPAIVASGGLSRMGRNQVHFASGLPGSAAGVVSGMRKDAELLVYVDVRRSLEDGALAWWVSENGVVLTEGDADGVVPLRYFSEVVGRTMDVGTLWRDGERVADLPAGIKGKIPFGKGPQGRGRGGGGRGRGSGRGGGRGGPAAGAS